ncbi:MAG: hypothetical protein J6X84_01715 [Treponema sp.]|nr:hypothetical protein [Treponema sp.]
MKKGLETRNVKSLLSIGKIVLYVLISPLVLIAGIFFGAIYGASAVFQYNWNFLEKFELAKIH